MEDCRLAVDIGGTFTDVVLQIEGRYFSNKVLTTHDAPDDAVVAGITAVLSQAGISAKEVDHTIHGTTLATNAIIERRGARTALITTQGFRDTLEFAFEHRFEQYDLHMQRPLPLVPRPLRLEVRERVAGDGAILIALEDENVREVARRLLGLKVESVAVSFLHAYRNGTHERRVREILNEVCPDLYVSISSEVCPEIREYERTSTTASNAYVQPLMAGYLRRLNSRLHDLGLQGPLLMIMSSGSLTSVDTAIRFPIRLVESGPAGGAILGEHIARELGASKAIAFDMGGTTAKIVLLNDYKARFSRAMEVARAYRFLPGSGFPLRIPVVDMIEIGAGGGSMAHVDSLKRLVVGPESAGSAPGPACYGRGGQSATVTDADLVLGKIDADAFAGGTIRLQKSAAENALRGNIADRLSVDVTAAAAGVAEIVDENMANAARVHATDNGEEIESRILIAIGGAAPLHAGRIAQKLGIDTFVVPNGAGVGSAYGFLRAPIAYEAVHSELIELDRFKPDVINTIFAQLRAEAENVVHSATKSTDLFETRSVYMRYRGQGHELAITLPVRDYVAEDSKEFQSTFESLYRRMYSRIIPGLRAEALTWVLTLTARIHRTSAPAPAPAPASAAVATNHPQPTGKRRQIFDVLKGSAVSASVIEREALDPGGVFSGPAIVVEPQTATYVPEGYHGRMNAAGHLVISREGATR